MKTIILSILIGAAFQFAYGDEEPVMTYGKPEMSVRTNRLAYRFQKDIERGELKKRTDRALGAIIHLAIYKLRLTGHKAEAQQLKKQWEGQWDGYVLRMRDLGDHKPLSQWLADKYAMLEFILGVNVCKALRLTDIKIINYGIPVVFTCVDDVDAAEYLLHFQPFAGTVSYWVSFIACVGGTWGTGFLFCAPISMGCEYLVKTFVAPKLNEPVWKLACHKGDFDGLDSCMGY